MLIGCVSWSHSVERLLPPHPRDVLGGERGGLEEAEGGGGGGGGVAFLTLLGVLKLMGLRG